MGTGASRILAIILSQLWLRLALRQGGRRPRAAHRRRRPRPRSRRRSSGRHSPCPWFRRRPRPRPPSSARRGKKRKPRPGRKPRRSARRPFIRTGEEEEEDRRLRRRGGARHRRRDAPEQPQEQGRDGGRGRDRRMRRGMGAGRCSERRRQGSARPFRQRGRRPPRGRAGPHLGRPEFRPDHHHPAVRRRLQADRGRVQHRSRESSSRSPASLSKGARCESRRRFGCAADRARARRSSARSRRTRSSR